MLKRMELSITHRPLTVIRFWREEGALDLNAPYQRGDVWGTLRRRNLIKSILLNVPIPSIIVNDRLKANWANDYSVVVIDGKQRITTILMFFDNQLKVPSEWFGENHGDSTLSELSQENQRRFRGSTLAFSEGTLPSLTAEMEVFELVNYGGVAQGQSDVI